ASAEPPGRLVPRVAVRRVEHRVGRALERELALDRARIREDDRGDSRKLHGSVLPLLATLEPRAAVRVALDRAVLLGLDCPAVALEEELLGGVFARRHASLGPGVGLEGAREPELSVVRPCRVG